MPLVGLSTTPAFAIVLLRSGEATKSLAFAMSFVVKRMTTSFGSYPPMASPTTVAIPRAASAAVNRHIRAARNSWSVSDFNLRQT